MARLVDSPEAAAKLADEILDPAREQTLVCVTIPPWSSEPLVDVEALEVALDGTATISVMPTGDASWELTYRLPRGLDVYGGAVRVWWPGVDEAADRHAYPLIFVHDRSDSASVVERIVAAFGRRGLLGRERPAQGTEHAAVVTRVLPSGAELDLADGTPAFAHRSHLSRHDLPPDRVVRVGQAVRLRIGDADSRRARVPVSLLPFEPDPWDRLVRDYGAGALIVGVVGELHNYGALVTLLPRFRGLVHKSQITREWVSHPEDFLTEGERVVVRIERLNDDNRRIELSMLDIPVDAEPAVASVFPDGPPWLPAVEKEIAVKEPEEEAAPLPFAPEQWPEVGEPEPARLVGHEAPHELELAVPEPELTVPEPAAPARAEIDELDRSVAEAREVQREVEALFAEGERQLDRLRGEALQIRRALERDLAEVRRRILELVETESSQLIGSTEAALAAARAEADGLREELDAAEEDRRRLLERARADAGRAERAAGAADAAREELRREREAANTLRDELEHLAPNDEARFRNEIHAAWEQATTLADRERYLWREPIFGPDFFESLVRVHGVSRERVVEVCAEVVCGRAPERAGMEVHPLRSSEGGGAQQRVREDGAKAYRASLQVGTASARRLHYWELPGGDLEFAKIVYHDDFSIR